MKIVKLPSRMSKEEIDELMEWLDRRTLDEVKEMRHWFETEKRHQDQGAGEPLLLETEE